MEVCSGTRPCQSSSKNPHWRWQSWMPTQASSDAKMAIASWWSMLMTFSSSAAEMPWWNNVCLHLSGSAQSALNSCRNRRWGYFAQAHHSAPMNCWKMAGWWFECTTSTSISCASFCACPNDFRARRPQVTAKWRFQTSLQSSVPMMLRCNALAWGFFCTCQLTCHNATMWFDTYPLSLRSHQRNPWWCWNTWLATWQHTPNSACLWNGKGLRAGVFKRYENKEPMVEIFSDVDWAADRETRRSVSGAAIYVGGCLAYSNSKHRRSCHSRAQSQKHMQLRRPPWMRFWSQPSFEGFVMQDLVDAGPSHGNMFTGEVSDRSTQPCRHCHKETQRSKARVVVLLFGYLERKQSGRNPWPRKHFQACHKSETTGPQPGTDQSFD